MKDPSPVNVLSAVLALQEMMTADAAPSVLYAALLRSLMTLSSSASALITELAQDAPEGRQMTITASCTAAEQPVTELELPELSSLAEKASACENAALSLSAHGGKPCCGNDRINHLLVLPLLYNKQPLASVFLFNREQAYDTGLIASLAPLTQLGAIIAGLLSMQRKHILIERALRDSEVRLRQVIDLVPHHIFAIVPSKGGRLIFANKALAEVYGMTTEEVVGKTQREITPMRAEEEHFLADDLEVIRSGKEKFIPEEIYTDPFGRVHYLQTTKIPFKAVDTGEPAVLGICVDITEQKKAAEERRHIEEQLQQSQKLESLGLLAGGIAHDFNNLLTGILGHASLALLDIPQASPAHARLRSVETAAHRAAQLCRQLLAYSGRGNFEIKPLNLSAIVGEMAEFLTVSVSKKAELRLELAPVLPAVDGDASQLHQVILNLLINSSESLGNKSGTITVSTQAGRFSPKELTEFCLNDQLAEGEFVVLEVTDSGCGMDAQTKAKIFDPFFSTKFPGRGLGMAAVLGVVRGHHGGIRITSNPEQGCRATVIFPVSERAAQSLPIRRSSEKLNDFKASGTVLVVDDEDTVREIAKAALERYGYRILEARDGVEALQILHEHQQEVSAILLDITMPRLSGEETLREIRLISQTVPVILSSGYNEQDALSRLTCNEMTGFIQKPYTGPELIAKVRQVLT